MRSEMLAIMGDMGIEPEKHHHEVASAQHELGLQVQHADQVRRLHADLQICDPPGRRRPMARSATFMPKPIYGDNGSGMHVHQSIWKGGKPLFAGSGYADLSDTCLYYIGGIIKHAKALNAFTNPLTNSYKRLIPGFEAPVLLAYSSRNRSASCRIPFSASPKGKRVEVRFPDPGANPYLAYAAHADGGPRRHREQDPSRRSDGQGPLCPAAGRAEAKVPTGLRLAARSAGKPRRPTAPSSRRAASSRDDFIDSYIELKMEEVYAFEHTPHPVEFKMYYSV